MLVIQAIATLYLPELNGEIINNGVAKGDTAYILSTGALMLGISAVVVAVSIVAVYWGSKTGMAFGRDVRGAIFRKVESFSRAELDTFGTRVAHHPQHERRPAGPDGRPDGPEHDDHRARSSRSAGSSWPSARTSRCRGSSSSSCRSWPSSSGS